MPAVPAPQVPPKRRLFLSADWRSRNWQEGEGADQPASNGCLLAFSKGQAGVGLDRAPASLVWGGWWRLQAFTPDRCEVSCRWLRMTAAQRSAA